MAVAGNFLGSRGRTAPPVCSSWASRSFGITNPPPALVESTRLFHGQACKEIVNVLSTVRPPRGTIAATAGHGHIGDMKPFSKALGAARGWADGIAGGGLLATTL